MSLEIWLVIGVVTVVYFGWLVMEIRNAPLMSDDYEELYEDEKKDEYANQRVIDELEEIKIRLSKKSFSEHCVEEVDNRIKELKQ